MPIRFARLAISSIREPTSISPTHLTTILFSALLDACDPQSHAPRFCIHLSWSRGDKRDGVLHKHMTVHTNATAGTFWSCSVRVSATAGTRVGHVNQENVPPNFGDQRQ